MRGRARGAPLYGRSLKRDGSAGICAVLISILQGHAKDVDLDGVGAARKQSKCGKTKARGSDIIYTQPPHSPSLSPPPQWPTASTSPAMTSSTSTAPQPHSRTAHRPSPPLLPPPPPTASPSPQPSSTSSTSPTSRHGSSSVRIYPPPSPPTLTPLPGRVAEQMGDLEHALSAYENALRHNATSVSGLTQVAGIARIKENYPKVFFLVVCPRMHQSTNPLPLFAPRSDMTSSVPIRQSTFSSAFSR